MFQTNKKATAIGAVFITLTSLLTGATVSADHSSDNGRHGGNARLAANGDSGSGYSRPYRQYRYLSGRDEQNIHRRIDGIRPFQRLEFLMEVMVRIDRLETNVNNSQMTPLRKQRTLALLADVRQLVQDRIDELTGVTTWTGTTGTGTTGTGTTWTGTTGTGTDTTAPAISSLMVSDVTSTGGILHVTSNETGTGHYVILTSGSAAPSSTQVRAGQNASSAVATAHGFATIMSGDNHFTFPTLTPNTSYVLYFVASDTAGNLSAQPMSTSFTTAVSGTWTGTGTTGTGTTGTGTTGTGTTGTGSTGTGTDSVAPTISSLTVSGATSTGLTLNVTVSESGTGYFVAVPNGSAIPSATQISLGQNASGTSASSFGSASGVAGSNQIPLTGLSPNTTYIVYFTMRDAAGNLQTVGNAVSVTTASQ